MDTDSNSSSKKKHFSPVSFAGGLFIALLVCGLIYLLIPSKQKNDNQRSGNAGEDTKDSSLFSGEHFYRIHHHKHIDIDAEPIVLMNNEEAMLEQGNLTERQRRLIELLPNAP